MHCLPHPPPMHSPRFNPTVYLSENAKGGDAVGPAISAVDPDAGDRITFSMTSGNTTLFRVAELAPKVSARMCVCRGGGRTGSLVCGVTKACVCLTVSPRSKPAFALFCCVGPATSYFQLCVGHRAVAPCIFSRACCVHGCMSYV